MNKKKLFDSYLNVPKQKKTFYKESTNTMKINDNTTKEEKKVKKQKKKRKTRSLEPTEIFSETNSTL